MSEFIVGPGPHPESGDAARYVRFQGTEPHASQGHYPGIFFLVNGLAKAGRLTPEQERFRRTHNAWYDAAYLNPSLVDPAVYDRGRNPGAVAWFKRTSTELLARVPGYLAILDAHRVGHERLSCDDPGQVVYEDEHQVVVIPHARGEAHA